MHPSALKTRQYGNELTTTGPDENQSTCILYIASFISGEFSFKVGKALTLHSS